MQWNEARKFDFNLSFIILALAVIGLVNLYSATHGQTATGLSRMFIAQVMWLGIGALVYAALTFFSFTFVKRLSWLIYLSNLGFLIAVKFVGKSFYGAQRWLDFGFFRFQPSETMKVSLVLVLALVLSRQLSKNQLEWKDLILPLIVVIIPFGLTVSQPDLGTALIMIAITGSMLLFMGLQRKIILAAFLSLSVALPLVWSFGMKPYQKQRVMTFLNPGKDLRGGGYNSLQSKIAVGSGLVFGKGFRKGTQSQLEFLPERHTDFIFSVLSEEHGFVGSSLTLVLFFLLFLSILNITQSTEDPFGALVCVGIGSILFWHFFINVGMVIGVLPVVGVPLPLLSYGGSSMLTTMGSLGLVSGVSLRRYFF